MLIHWRRKTENILYFLGHILDVQISHLSSLVKMLARFAKKTESKSFISSPIYRSGRGANKPACFTWKNSSFRNAIQADYNARSAKLAHCPCRTARGQKIPGDCAQKNLSDAKHLFQKTLPSEPLPNTIKVKTAALQNLCHDCASGCMLHTLNSYKFLIVRIGG